MSNQNTKKVKIYKMKQKKTNHLFYQMHSYILHIYSLWNNQLHSIMIISDKGIRINSYKDMSHMTWSFNDDT